MKKIMLGAAVFALLGGALAAYLQRRANADPAFCVSCHLPGGGALHAPKMRRMRQLPHVDLAGAHDAAPRGRAGCPECHHGSGAGERAVIFMLQAKNTAKYFLYQYREPERLEYPVSDAVCGGCHAGLRSRAAPASYHGHQSHELPGKAICAGCHPAHTAIAQGGPWGEAILDQCGLCHRNPAMHHEIRRMLGLAPLAPR
ncbi:MAG: hypothetical protein HY804_01670 [Nitrospinae bacterium]|nr:hypothetical protein [Nitrospinota bacterium]